jgi:phosphoribosylformylglycinamidine cyclo-ligase
VQVRGGGITDNLPRILPEGLGAEVELGSWEIPPLFKYLEETGNVVRSEMLRTFNCGQGFLVIVSKEEEARTLDALGQAMEEPAVIGRIVKDANQKVSYNGEFVYAASDD